MRHAFVAAVTAALAFTAPLYATASASAAGSAAASEPTRSGERTGPAPLRLSAHPVPGQYIVTTKPTADVTAAAADVGVKPLFTFEKVMRGFAAKLTDAQLAKVRALPNVVSVEQDGEVNMIGAAPAAGAAGKAVAPAASWGLDRIDQRYMPLNNSFSVRATGKGANAYILDTGIDYHHAEFGGRAVPGFDAFPLEFRNGADCQGHGTHVAGTVGGATYGVARQANLISVRVLDCQGKGSNAGVIAGIEWAAAHASLYRSTPAVLNASLGSDRSDAVNAAVNALSDLGVLPVVAAGNSSADACGVSPASAERVVTVGASDWTDAETSFSNYGTCLELYAPGAAIESARLGGGSVALNGTSMAAPHVAGVALLHRTANPAASSSQAAGWLDAVSTRGVLSGLSEGSPNKLLYTSGL
ncbi:S8 family peptidase [Streptomyces sp. TRM64462]|uniref:S8 family peptidase n=1 Tax=Streptomyces sp. TRM64462 TaxID=2741726 RepID=UPI001586CFE3|nr:S8 family peptidase [Streptomyces sp. TRM64462]